VSDRPLGATVTVAQLDADPHPIHHALRAAEPVAWLPALDGWLVTGHEVATAAMRDAATYTVDDPRFSTAQVIGASMLSLDGAAHDRHRAPFTEPFRAVAVRERFAAVARERAHALVDSLRPTGRGELRRGFAGPMAAAIVTRALGVDEREVHDVLGWYDAIVASVTAISAGRPPSPEGAAAFAALRARLQPVICGERGDSLLAAAVPGSGHRRGAGDASLSDDQIASNAAVLLFGGIETTEGMIANAALALLHRPDELDRVRADPAAIGAVLDESLRLEPAAAVIDRYATRDTELGGVRIARGDLVRISIAGANRDPAVFGEPDRYDPSRANARRHLAFAQGPHVCVGVHVARLEAQAALQALLTLDGLRLDPDAPAPAVRGLVFRKPVRLDAVWRAGHAEG
jgi:cytochrome P450